MPDSTVTVASWELALLLGRPAIVSLDTKCRSTLEPGRLVDMVVENENGAIIATGEVRDALPAPDLVELRTPATHTKVVGVIYPPPDIRAIVDKTAGFVARNGEVSREGLPACHTPGKGRGVEAVPRVEWAPLSFPRVCLLLPHPS